MVLIRWDVFFLLWAGMMVFHLVTYFGSQYLEGEPHTVGGSLDERIPFHPGWIYIYSSWFVLLLGVPALLNIVAPELCLKYMLAHSIDQLLSNIIYLIYPTTFERPVPPKKGLTGFVIGTVYGANHRFLNCAPSVHCSVSFLFAFAALAAPMLPLWLRLVIVVWSLAIVASTMLVKQHMVIDAVTALPAAAVCWLLAGLVNFSSLAAKFSEIKSSAAFRWNAADTDCQKASQSLRPQAQIKCKTFLPAACTSAKILFGSQTCER